MTWQDLVRQYWPSATDEEVDSILWNCTCFPFGSVDKIRDQLSALAERSAGCVDKALELSFRDLEEALGKAKQRHIVDDSRTDGEVIVINNGVREVTDGRAEIWMPLTRPKDPVEDNKGSKIRDVRPKPSPRAWARWAGYDCAE